MSGVLGILRGSGEIDRFRRELKEHFGVRHCFLVSSGKAAFALTLLALKDLFPDRDTVLVPAFTCFSVPSSIVGAGLEVRLCDLDGEALDFDFEKLSAIVSVASRGGVASDPEQTRAESAADSDASRYNGAGSTAGILAIVPTHLFGIPADVGRLRRLVRDPGITIIEDAAQAMGETRQDRKIGTLGDVGFFSLGRGKALSVVEGGVILTDRDDLAERIDRLVNRLPPYGALPLLGLIFKAAALMAFIRPSLFWIPKAVPFLKLGETLFEPDFPLRKMSSFQAGLARNWWEKLARLRRIRQKNAMRWTAVLEEAGLREALDSGIQSLAPVRFPLRVRDEGRKKRLLREGARIGIMPVYPTSIDAIPELKGKTGAGAYPVAEGCARELVTLPTHGFVTEHDAAEITGLVSRALGEGSVESHGNEAVPAERT